MSTLTQAKCVNGLPPSTRVKAPSEQEFGRDFYLPDDNLKKIGDALIRDAGAGLGDLLEAEITIGYLWRKKSAKSRGKEIGVKISRVGGLTGHYAKADYVIEISAPWARESAITHWQLEAAIYDELAAVSVEILEDGETRLALRPPDFKGYTATIRRYGLYSDDLERSQSAFVQAPMFDLSRPVKQDDAPGSPRTNETGSNVVTVTPSGNRARTAPNGNAQPAN